MTHPVLARVVERARASAGEPIAVRTLRAAAGDGGARHPDALEGAARALELLDGALRLHRGLLDGGAVRSGESEGDPVSAGLGGVWMLGSAGELIAGCGDEAAELWGRTANELVRAQMLEFEDLYDAGRAPERYLTVAEMRAGGLLALAARLGSILLEPEATASGLEQYGRRLGVAVEIRDDVLALEGSNGGAPGAAQLLSGNYTLPLLYALESEPELAGSLGRPLDPEGLPGLVARIRDAGGVKRAERERDRRVRDARAAIAGFPGTELIALADELGEGR